VQGDDLKVLTAAVLYESGLAATLRSPPAPHSASGRASTHPSSRESSSAKRSSETTLPLRCAMRGVRIEEIAPWTRAMVTENGGVSFGRIHLRQSIAAFEGAISIP
jgi:hypothetical protein